MFEKFRESTDNTEKKPVVENQILKIPEKSQIEKNTKEKPEDKNWKNNKLESDKKKLSVKDFMNKIHIGKKGGDKKFVEKNENRDKKIEDNRDGLEENKEGTSSSNKIFKEKNIKASDISAAKIKESSTDTEKDNIKENRIGIINQILKTPEKAQTENKVEDKQTDNIKVKGEENIRNSEVSSAKIKESSPDTEKGNIKENKIGIINQILKTPEKAQIESKVESKQENNIEAKEVDKSAVEKNEDRDSKIEDNRDKLEEAKAAESGEGEVFREEDVKNSEISSAKVKESSNDAGVGDIKENKIAAINQILKTPEKVQTESKVESKQENNIEAKEVDKSTVEKREDRDSEIEDNSDKLKGNKAAESGECEAFREEDVKNSEISSAKVKESSNDAGVGDIKEKKIAVINKILKTPEKAQTENKVEDKQEDNIVVKEVDNTTVEKNEDNSQNIEDDELKRDLRKALQNDLNDNLKSGEMKNISEAKVDEIYEDYLAYLEENTNFEGQNEQADVMQYSDAEFHDINENDRGYISEKAMKELPPANNTEEISKKVVIKDGSYMEFGFQRGLDNWGSDAVVGSEIQVDLKMGTLLDRHGNEKGSYMTNNGTEFKDLHMNVSEDKVEAHTYEVVKPFKTKASVIAEQDFDPYKKEEYNEAIQYQAVDNKGNILSVKDLIEQGFIREVKTNNFANKSNIETDNNEDGTDDIAESNGIDHKMEGGEERERSRTYTKNLEGNTGKNTLSNVTINKSDTQRKIEEFNQSLRVLRDLEHSLKVADMKKKEQEIKKQDREYDEER